MFTFPANAEFIYLAIGFFNLHPSVTFRVVKHTKTVRLKLHTYTLIILNSLLPLICYQRNFAGLDFSALVLAKN